MNARVSILIIEDSQDDCDLLLSYLKKTEIEVSRHLRVEDEPSLRGALKSGDWDLVVSDFRMPHFNAFAALSVCQEVCPHIPFIIVSGTIGEDIAVEAIKFGASDYVLKGDLTRLGPAILRELNEAMERQQRLQMEKALKQSEEEIRQMQKLEAVGQLASGIAHDFNNILATILAQTEMLEDIVEEKFQDAPLEMASLARGLEQIRKSGDRASKLTKQLLTFSRKQVSQARAVNVNELVTELQKMLRRIIEEHITFEVQMPEEPIFIRSDPVQFEQVIMNLVVNARDAMPRGGTLNIALRKCEKGDRNSVSHALSKANPQTFSRNAYVGKYMELAVSDTGIGMSPEVQRKVFEPFFTTKPVGKGTGLGLSTVYGIVKQNGGFIEVKSQPGIGSTFFIYIPTVSDGLPADPGRNRTGRDFEGTESILVVEDEDDLRGLIYEILSANGYKVQTANNGQQALKLLNQTPKGYNLVISDLVMPRLGGRELYEKTKDQFPGTQFIFISGYPGNKPMDRDQSDNAVFIEKPFSLRALLQKVRSLLDGKLK